MNRIKIAAITAAIIVTGLSIYSAYYTYQIRKNFVAMTYQSIQVIQQELAKQQAAQK
jgi:hypothetical protein